MRTLAQSLGLVGLGFWVVILISDIAGNFHPTRDLAFASAICWAIAAVLFFIADRRKKRVKPL
jgi:hypothetical protein